MFKCVFLGIVQGITEFLPVSSSGHLVLFQHYLGFQGPATFFDALLHLGTLAAVIILYRSRINNLLTSLTDPKDKYHRYLWLLVVGTIPIAIVGFLARDKVRQAFESPLAAGIGLLITGTVLLLAHRVKSADREYEDMGFMDAISIGLAQILALLPGISRSGITISAGLFKRFNSSYAAEFSFLLMIPSVLGATVLEITDSLTSPALILARLPSYLVGTLVATVTGIIAIKFLLSVLKKGRLELFGFYCLSVGSIIVILRLTPFG